MESLDEARLCRALFVMLKNLDMRDDGNHLTFLSKKRNYHVLDFKNHSVGCEADELEQKLWRQEGQIGVPQNDGNLDSWTFFLFK